MAVKERAIMRSGFLHGLSGLVLASLAIMAAGCSQDTLNSGSQNLSMTYTPSPSGAGRFDVASFSINRIQSLPADPDEAALFGTERLLFRFSPFEANLTLATPVPYSNIALSTGGYNVTLIEFTPPSLVDNNLAPPPYASCVDGIDQFNAQSAGGLPPVFLFTPATNDLSGLDFTVSPGQNNLAVTINVPGLIAGYEAAFTCQYVPCPGCPVDPRPTLTAFDTAAFRLALLANITIE
jgi:hypothetical protein